MPEPTESAKDALSSPIAEGRNLLEMRVQLYTAVTHLWAHADIYAWHRAQVIVAIQAGVLAGAYAVHEHIVAALLLVLGAIVSRVLQLAVKRDEQTRNSYLQFIDPLAKAIFRPPLYDGTLPFRMIPEPDSSAPVRAGHLMSWTFSGFVILNVALAGYFIALSLHGRV